MSDLPFDISFGRHGGNEESRQSNLFVHPHKRLVRQRLRAFVAGCGWMGATSVEIACAIDHPTERDPRDPTRLRKYHPNEISGRISEMKALGTKHWSLEHQRLKLDGDALALEEALWDSGRRRDGCAVLVSNPRWVGALQTPRQ